MLSRALTAKPRKIFKHGPKSTFQSVSVSDYDDFSTAFGFMEDLPLVLCDQHHDHRGQNVIKQSCGSHSCGDDTGWAHLSLKEVLRASVGVLGDQSRLGMTEKVVLPGGKICALKRFRKLSVGKSEFGKRVERFAQASVKSKNLVLPVTAYLYAKRIKFVLCDYHPMGSLADLLAGSRRHGHTALDWNQMLTIILHIARAIAFIHAISPAQEKNMQMNVHGNIKASNVMINTDFSPCLSDYGIAQIAERVEVLNSCQWRPVSPSDVYYNDDLCQKCDVYNFGVIILDILGGPDGISLFMKNPVNEIKSGIKTGEIEFFKFSLKEEKEQKQTWQVLDIALACTNKQRKARPTIEQILLYLGNVCNNIA